MDILFPAADTLLTDMVRVSEKVIVYTTCRGTGHESKGEGRGEATGKFFWSGRP